MERDSMSGKMLISEQITTDKGMQVLDIEETFKEEIEELKENLDRKEYLLQFNEQKYY